MSNASDRTLLIRDLPLVLFVVCGMVNVATPSLFDAVSSWDTRSPLFLVG